MTPDDTLAPPLSDFKVCAYRDGHRLALVGPVWAFNPHVTYDDFAMQYRTNPIAALRDLASQPPTLAGSYHLYPTLETVRACANRARAHPFTPDGVLDPAFRPTAARYYMHFDLSARRDSTGVAMVHSDGPRIIVDFVLEIVPKDGRIRIAQSERLVKVLQRRGFHIARVSADQWGSAQFRDNLEAHGIKTSLLSVDRTATPHETIFELIHNGRLDFYEYTPLFNNLADLVLVKGGRKIDHVPGGAKDVADSLAGAVASLIEAEGVPTEPMVIPLFGSAEKIDEAKLAKDFPTDEDGVDKEGDFDDFAYMGGDDPHGSDDEGSDDTHDDADESVNETDDDGDE